MSLGSLPRDALDALDTIASNLQREPQNPKFRTLRLSNAAVQRRLGSHAARAALAGLGFVKREDAMTVDVVDMNAVERTLAAVKAAKSTAEEITWNVVDTTMPSPPPKQAWGTQQSPSPKKPPKPRAPLDAERNRVTRPNTSWDDVVGLGQVKTELQQVAREVKGGPRWDDRLILLYGPPGCGKGLLAACLATEWGRGDLVTVHGAELRSEFSRSKSEAKRFYDRARSLAPCVLLVRGLELNDCGDALMDLKGSDDRVIVIVTCSVLPTTPSRRRRALRSRATEGLAAFDQLLNVPMPSSFERARLVATCLTQSGGDSPAPPYDVDVDDLAGQMLGFAPRAVVRVVDAARKGASRRKPRANVLESDFDMVLDAVPSLDTLAPNREASDGLVCDWGGELRWRAITPAAERALRAADGDESEATPVKRR
jgi:hypothetical protein